MNPADLRDQLHASLSTVTPAPLSVEDVRRAGLRRRRTREGLAGLAVAAVAVGAFALVGGTGPDRDALQPGGPTTGPTATAGPSPLPASAAWEAWKAGHPGTASEPFSNGSGTWGAVASDAKVTVAEYRDGAFREVGSVELQEQQSVTALVMATLTGTSEAVPDVVATGPAGNAVLTSVVRPVSVGYELATFASCGAAGPCSALPSAEVAGNSVVAAVSSCVPSCAEASRRHIAYTWSGTQFTTPALSGACAAGSTGWYWEVVKVTRSGSSVDLTYRVADARCDKDVEPYLEGVGDTRREVLPADTPVTGAGQSTVAAMQPGIYEVKHSERTVTGFEVPYRP